jgi:ABC-type cobalamin/Fe3+-siderophores transport system ATPase subunit
VDAVIESIEIKNLRGIREGKLEGLTPLTILVGPNGCGKSTILEALLIAAHPELPEAVGQVVVGRAGVREGARWLAWRTDASNQIGITVRTTEALVGQKRSLRFEHPQKGDTARVRCQAEDLEGRLQSVELRFFGNNEYEYARGAVKLKTPAPEVCFVHTSGPPGDPLHSLLTQTVVQGHRDQALSVLKDLLPAVQDIVILTEQNLPIVHVVYKDYSVPVALAGDGVHALVRLVLETAARRRGMVLIEEPELHQHPAAIARSARVLVAAARAEIQVVLSTHSLEFIDSILVAADEQDLQRLSVFRLKLDNGGLISHRLLGPDVAQARQVIEDDLR